MSEVKAVACELPKTRGIPLSRFSLSEIRREVLKLGIVTAISVATIGRWLREDAIQPWRCKSWVFPRDPAFGEKAGPILDLYEGRWQGRALKADEYVISADEKTSIQARRRRHAPLPTAAGRCLRVEHEYKRQGALAYIAGWDVHRAQVFGRCEPTTGIEPFERLVEQVMSQEPYRSARRVFWIVDNGSSHRGRACVRRLQKKWPNLIPLHTPIHASWLNQIETYFSVVQRKVLTPNDFSSLQQVRQRLLQFQEHYQSVARPFKWKFTTQGSQQTSVETLRTGGRPARVASRRLTVMPQYLRKQGLRLGMFQEWFEIRMCSMVQDLNSDAPLEPDLTESHDRRSAPEQFDRVIG